MSTEEQDANLRKSPKPDFPYFVAEQHEKKFPGFLPPIGDNTSIITKEKADQCIAAYKTHSEQLTIYNGLTLKGYVINIPNLKALLEQNPHELFLEFGIKPELLGADPSEQYFTLIISGYTDKNHILRDKEGNHLFYEYIRPCPPNCPR